MVYRSYFSKDATAYSGSPLNSGGNPILKLIRGGGANGREFSRIFFELDLQGLYERIQKKEIPGGFHDINSEFKRNHILRFYNTMFYDRDSMGRKNTNPSHLPSSYKLGLYLIDEEWDEGMGYDYLVTDGTDTKLTSSQGVNFLNRKSGVTWNQSALTSTLLKEIDIDLGDGNLEIDVTEMIELILDVANDDGVVLLDRTSFMLAFIENGDGVYDKVQTLELFGKDTHTYFEPHLETSWDGRYIIRDDRYNIPLATDGKLFLNTTFNGQLVNIDEDSLKLEILNDEDAVIVTYENGFEHHSLGVYSHPIDFTQFDEGTYSDRWSFRYKNKDFSIVNNFETTETNPFSNDSGESREYSINVSGIRENEKVKDNDRRKLNVRLRDSYSDDLVLPSKVSFDLYVKVGSMKLFIIKDSEFNIDKDRNYYEFIDFSWLIPHDYFIDITIHCNGEVRNREALSFNVIDSKMVNKINGL